MFRVFLGVGEGGEREGGEKATAILALYADSLNLSPLKGDPIL